MHQFVTVIILITTSIALAQVSNHHDIRTSPIQQTHEPEDLTPQELHQIKQSQNFKHLECLQDLSIKDKSTCPKPSNKF